MFALLLVLLMHYSWVHALIILIIKGTCSESKNKGTSFFDYPYYAINDMSLSFKLKTKMILLNCLSARDFSNIFMTSQNNLRE